MKVKKDDLVIITKGKWRGKKGKVLKAIPLIQKIVVEGVNLVKRHRKPRKSGEKGKILEMASPICVANVKLICKKCNQPTRVTYKIRKLKTQGPESAARVRKSQEKKIRICKKCQKPT